MTESPPSVIEQGYDAPSGSIGLALCGEPGPDGRQRA
jgi:hypothetical protein